MFSWVVRERAPDAVRVLDMQESRARLCAGRGERAVAAMASRAHPPAFPPLQREIAACHRSDLVLVCSPSARATQGRLGRLGEQAGLAPLLRGAGQKCLEGVGREGADFVFVGTALHAPNVDAVTWLAREARPLIRRGSGRPVQGTAPTDNSGAGSRVRALPTEIGVPGRGLRRTWGRRWEARVLPAPPEVRAGIKTRSWTRGPTARPSARVSFIEPPDQQT